MGYRFIDENTLINIADALRIKSKTTEPILGADIANFINNMATGSPFMEGTAIAWDSNNIYMGDGITDISNGQYNNLFNLANGYMFPSLTPSTLIIGNNVINAYNAFSSSYPQGKIKNIICGPNVVNYNNTFCSRQDSNFCGVPSIGNSVVDMGWCYNGCSSLSALRIKIPDSVILMPNAFSYCTNMNFKPDIEIGNNVCYAPNAFNPCPYINRVTFLCEDGQDNLGNISYMFQGCSNMYGRGYIGQAYNTYYAYAGCSNITGPTYVGNRLVEFHSSTFSACSNLSGPASCGNNVRNMRGVYSSKKVNIAACGPQVAEFDSAYAGCLELTEANIGENVVYASRAFSGCSKLTTPVMGNNVIDMSYLYSDCVSLTGAPICSNCVRNMAGAYSNCRLIQGEPAISPMTTTNLYYAYYECPNIYGNLYLIARSSLLESYVFNIDNAFTGRDTSNRLNIFIQNFTYNFYNNTTEQWEPGYDCIWSSQIHNSNIIGTPLVWTDMEDGNGFYNEEANIYVYSNYNYKEYKDGKDASWAWAHGTNEKSFAETYDPEAINIFGAFAESGYTGNFVCSDNVVNMSKCYMHCGAAVSPFVCGENVIDMSGAYETCINAYGDYVSGSKVENMFNTYFGTNAKGAFACGPNVINFANCYASCSNITTQPVCGDNVIDMNCTYMSCANITGSPAIGLNVKYMNYTYSGCYNLTGDVIIPRSVVWANMTFSSCSHLNGKAFVPNTCIDHKYIFAGCSNLKQIVFEDGIPEIQESACAGCTNANVYIPNSVCNICSGALGGVKRVCYYGTLNTAQWGASSYGKHEPKDDETYPEKIEPTCTEGGYTGRYECKYCGAIAESEVIKALGHDVDEETGICKRCKKKVHKIESIWEETSSGIYKFEQQIGTNDYKSNNYHRSSTTAETTWTITLNSPQQISIPWQVQSESVNYDYFYIYIDDVTKLGPVGGTNLQTGILNVTLDAGSHTVKATYRKDGSGDSGMDAAIITLNPIKIWIEDDN